MAAYRSGAFWACSNSSKTAFMGSPTAQAPEDLDGELPFTILNEFLLMVHRVDGGNHPLRIAPHDVRANYGFQIMDVAHPCSPRSRATVSRCISSAASQVEHRPTTWATGNKIVSKT